jgi:hypothetical protein
LVKGALIYVFVAVGYKDNFSRFSPEPNPDMESAEVCRLCH